jgi:hypothetical protein
MRKSTFDIGVMPIMLSKYRADERAVIQPNRRDFVQEFDIVAKVRRVPVYVQIHAINFGPNHDSRIDHLEVFKRRNGDFVLVNSPYLEVDSLIEDGWVKYKKMYSMVASTYIKVVTGQKRMSRRLLWEKQQ